MAHHTIAPPALLLLAPMPDIAPPGLQRAQGGLHIALGWREGRTRLVRLRQSGCLKARFPRRLDPSWAEIVQLNNSGGVAAGDRLASHLALAAGARAVLTTASAERIYRCAPGGHAAIVCNSLEIGPNACADWLPQDTILFNNAALARTLSVRMDDTASLLGAETLIFGRTAMNEQVRAAHLRDTISIRRGGRLILHDTLRPPAAIAETLRRAAAGADARAIATVFAVSPTIADALDPVRDILGDHPSVAAGASAWDGMLVIRLLAREPPQLRHAIAALLHRLRAGRMLPTVWTC